MKNLKSSILGLGIVAMTIPNIQAQETKEVFTEPVKLSSAVNSKQHDESYPLLSPDGKTLYYVRTYTDNDGAYVKGDQNIMVSNWENNNWSLGSDDLPNLNNEFNNAVVGISKSGDHLFLLNQYPSNPKKTAKGISEASKDGKTWGTPFTINVPGVKFEGDHYGAYMHRDERVIIFTANIKDRGMGHEDLYVSLKDEDGNWSAPKHMGYNINTATPDFAPFLSHDKKYLYFSSFGHDGLGSSDIYVSERLDDTYLRWSKPKNLGAPVNTEHFDGYLTINEKKEILFSSNRDKGTYSDIYSSKIETVVVEPPVDPRKEAELAIIELKSKMDLKLIYFETDKAQIRENDAKILNAVKALMTKYDMVGVTVSGHTDARASEAYNMALSERRANAAMEYLVKNGISRDRIKVEFFGESRPVETNSTPEGRYLNRRVELKLFLMP
ncbi:OmpA family protein [Luteibaculum oceani]|uniref:OmpA family protein n=1 Tax=Luteibaculum oceani TaxID=1294296 RepID=A0A5C6UUD9_9FLAO|nr:OmpA family protein [Luteibaculum oceani]TXC76992.1 OmpA family protein [Luteibaculum oceani]